MPIKMPIERLKKFTIQWIPLLPATYLLALAIWGFGLYHSFSTCKSIQGLTAGQLHSIASFLWSLFWVSAFHQLLIFRSLHKLDYDQETKELFNGWLKTWPDWLLRFFAICLLLCVGGELPRMIALIRTHATTSQVQAVFHLTKYTNEIVHLDDLCVEGEITRTLVLIKTQEITNQMHALYFLTRNTNGIAMDDGIKLSDSQVLEPENPEGLPWFSFSLFLVLCFWDFGAIKTILKIKRHQELLDASLKAIPKVFALNWERHAWVFFAASDLCGLASWAIVLWALYNPSQIEIAAFPSLFLGLYAFIIFCRLIFELLMPIVKKTWPPLTQPLEYDI